jgi:hypothetical protein
MIQDIRINDKYKDKENKNTGFLPSINEKPNYYDKDKNLTKPALGTSLNHNPNVILNSNTKSAYQSDNEDQSEANERFQKLTRMRIKMKRDREAADNLQKAKEKIEKEKAKEQKMFKLRT